MPHRLEISTASAGAAAATSFAWLPTAEDIFGVLAHPAWADILPFLGAVWLLIQGGFYLYDRLRPKSDD